MINGMYTVFVSKSGKHEDAELLVETTDKSKYNSAKQWAKDNGYTITKEYLPNTELSQPNFVKTLN